MTEKQEPVKIEDMDQPAEELTPEQAVAAEGGYFWTGIGSSGGDTTRFSGFGMA